LTNPTKSPLFQIAPYSGYAPGNGYTPGAGPLLREAQTRCLTIPNTGMVVISDLIDDVNQIHPPNKRDVGLRLANYALAETYHQKHIAYRSPLYKGMQIEKNKIRIFFSYVDSGFFSNADSGLVCKGGKPTGFFIAGEDRKFLPATVEIDGNTVIVSHKDIKKPVAVRFDFSNAAIPNLFGKNGLPVNLFRTDDWNECRNYSPFGL